MTDKPKPCRRWLQFSLRTLFVVVTVFCVWLTIIAKQAREQRLAVEAILAIGGTVSYEHAETRHGVTQSPQSLRLGLGPPPRPPGPEWLRRIIGDDYFFSVDSVVISGRATSDAVLVHLKGLSDLEFLALVNARITDAGLEHLKGLTNLKILTLWGTQVVGTGLVHLNGLTDLEMLELQGPITDAGLEYVKGLTNLKSLFIKSTEVTDRGLEHLKEFSNLELLVLNCENISDAGLVHLKELSHLKQLNLQLTNVTEQGVKTLQQALPNCEFSYTDNLGFPTYVP